MVGLDLIAFLAGAAVWSVVRNKLLTESVITLQKEVIGLQNTNLLLSQELQGMRDEIRELRDALSREESAHRHFRNNVTQVLATSSYLQEIETRGGDGSHPSSRASGRRQSAR